MVAVELLPSEGIFFGDEGDDEVVGGGEVREEVDVKLAVAVGEGDDKKVEEGAVM